MCACVAVGDEMSSTLSDMNAIMTSGNGIGLVATSNGPVGDYSPPPESEVQAEVRLMANEQDM